MMKHLITILLSFLAALPVQAHKMDGQLTGKGNNVTVNKAQVSLSGFKKTDNGRVYELWIASRLVFAFYLENPWESIDGEFIVPDEKARYWIIEDTPNSPTMEAFYKALPDTRKEIKGVEELAGKANIQWHSENDYTMTLDLKGVAGIWSFKGSFYEGDRRRVAGGAGGAPGSDHGNLLEP